MESIEKKKNGFGRLSQPMHPLITPPARTEIIEFLVMIRVFLGS
jgi:hypothetical protein